MWRFGAFLTLRLAVALAAASLVLGTGDLAVAATATHRASAGHHRAPANPRPHGRTADDPAVDGFSAAPAHFNPAIPATRAYFIRRVDRGGAFYDRVRIVNHGATPLHLYVYPVEALTGTTSGVVYANRHDPLHRAGAWMQSSVSTLTVAPGAAIDAGFLMRVPHNARPGDHVAGLALEDADPTTSSGRFAVTEVFRVVVGIHLIVSGHVHYRLRAAGLALASLPGTKIPALVVSLYNYGDKLCRPALTATLEGPRGAHVTSVTRHLDTILPQDRIAYPLPWPRPLSAGRYWARVRTTGCGQPAGLAESIALPSALTGTRAHPAGLLRAAAITDRVRYALGALALIVVALFWRPLLAVLSWPAVGLRGAVRRRGSA